MWCFILQNGHLGSTGVCFDIGMTTRNALMKFRRDQVNPIVGAQAEKAAGRRATFHVSRTESETHALCIMTEV